MAPPARALPPGPLCMLPCVPIAPRWPPIVPVSPMPGLLVVPPPIGPMVLLVEELLSRGVLLVVPTLPVGLAPPELTVVCADVPVCAPAGRENKAAPAISAAAVT